MEFLTQLAQGAIVGLIIGLLVSCIAALRH
jgi:hypothetical protein